MADLKNRAVPRSGPVVRFLKSVVRRRVVRAKGAGELAQPLGGALPRSGLPASGVVAHSNDHGRTNLHQTSRVSS